MPDKDPESSFELPQNSAGESGFAVPVSSPKSRVMVSLQEAANKRAADGVIERDEKNRRGQERSMPGLFRQNDTGVTAEGANEGKKGG